MVEIKWVKYQKLRMETLCNDVYLNSFSTFLSVRDLGVLGCVSKMMRVMADNNEVWRKLYLDFRKKSFSILPTSVHIGSKRWFFCRYNGSREEWTAAGKPCSQLSHYQHHTLAENQKKAVNYHNFKRAYAKTAYARVTKFTRSSLNHICYLRDRQEQFRREILIMEDDIQSALKRARAPADFKDILSLPPSTPPHMKQQRKRIRK